MSEPNADRQHYTITLAALTGGALAFSLQQTMVIPALPFLQREFETTTAWATWIVTSFLLTASVATPLLGKLGDQYGKERLLVITLTLFLAGCVGAAAAWDLWSLIAFRGLQGVAGAIFPLSFAIIRDEFPREKVPLALGLVSAVLGVGGGLGLVLSGVLVDQLSWRWLFIVGAVVVAVALVLVHRFVPESPVKTSARLDLPGALLLSGGLVALLLALTEGEAWGWGSGRIVGLLALAAALLVLWGAVERRVREPMVDMRMLAHRPVLFTNLTALVAGFAMFGTFVLVPNFLETPRGLPADLARLVDYGFGASTTKAGLYMLPGSLAMLVTGPLASVLGRRYGTKWPLVAGMLMIAAGGAVLASVHEATWHVVVAMLVLTSGVAFAFAAMPTLISQSVRQTEMGVATGVNTVMRMIGAVIGGQVGAVLLTTYTIGGTSVPSETGFVVAFWASTVAALVAAGFAVLVSSRRSTRTAPPSLGEGEAPDPSRRTRQLTT